MHYISRHPMSGSDLTGTLFIFDGQLLRAVDNTYIDFYIELLNSGVLSELANLGYIPHVKISNTKISGYKLILEIERVPRVIYSYEFTYSMLRDAALFVLNFNKILNSYGYELTDAHVDNLTFKNSKPIFLDLGSFRKVSKKSSHIFLENYIKSFIFPLNLWVNFGEFIGRRALLGGEYVGTKTMLSSFSILFKFSPSFLKNILVKLYDNIFLINAHSLNFIQSKLKSKYLFFNTNIFLLNWITILSKSIARLFVTYFIFKISKFLLKNNIHDHETRWENYHSTISNEINYFISYDRFKVISDLLTEINPLSITEIGCNQGALADILINRFQNTSYTAIDIDGGALDSCYKSLKLNLDRDISYALVDIMRPMLTIPKDQPQIRFKSDVVIALAVTHHMIISQCNTIEFTLSQIAGYSNDWVFIEYMPWGLSTTIPSEPLPSCYRQELFDKTFKELFDEVAIHKLEDKRILYTGRIRK